MPAKPPISARKRFLKLTLMTFGVIAAVIVGLHIWFVNHARKMISEIVFAKSNGRLKLELSQLSYNFLTNDLQVKEAELYSTDTTNSAVSYRIGFGKLSIRVGSFWPLLFKNEVSIDSIEVRNPQITVTQWRIDTTKNADREEISLSRQMGKIYNSMLDGLEAFDIQRIVISDASLKLVNKLQPVNEPVFISHINFDLVRNSNDQPTGDKYAHNERSVNLSTTNQDIALPGGRHRLSFSHFNLNLFNERIELDSCTVTALARDSLKSSYTIFFKKLLLSGVDFDAMYRYDLIRADSVYCDDPQFEININTLAASGPKAERPDPNKIIQELTGDLDLSYVGVKSAGIKINITGKNTRSLFNSNKDDFEMRGLRINADSSSPVVVDRFDMLVRDYHLYNEDSSAAYTFDSIQFVNNKITLNNFTVATTSSPDKTRSERDFKIPYFQLTGLDWYQLIFEENLVAREAVLYNPVINYVNRSGGNIKKGGKKNIFRALRLVDDLITVDKIALVNGQINMVLSPETSINIKNANLSLNNTTEGYSELRQAVSRLSFSDAVIKVKELTAIIRNAAYSGKELVHADEILVSSGNKAVNAVAKDVLINNLLINEETETILVDGLKWKSARINLRQVASSKKKKQSNIKLTNILGGNTELHYFNGENTITSGIRSFSLASFSRNALGDAEVTGLGLRGDHLDFKNRDMHFTAASYDLASDRRSFFSEVKMDRIQQQDTLLFESSRISFSPDFNSLMKGDVHLFDLDVMKPILRINNWNEDTIATVKKGKGLLRIDQFNAVEPDIRVALHRNDSATFINLPPSVNSSISATGLQSDSAGLRIGNLALQSNSVTLVQRTGEVLGVDSGKVDIEISDLQYANKKNGPAWAFVVNSLHLKNPNSFAIGPNRNRLHLAETSIGNFNLSSESVNNVGRLLKDNVSAWVRSTTGHYIDSNTTLRWYNADYNSNKRTLSLDSFQYHPTQSRDSVMANAAYQTDYITVKTGPVLMNGFNLDRFEKDSSLIADTIQVNHPVITVYRDKTPPFLAGNLKPLPVDMVRNINIPVDIKKLKAVDGLLEYTEKNPKSGAEGTLALTHIDVEVSDLKNRGYNETDSMTIMMNAYLMDSAQLRLMVKQSYTDSLKGFLMTLRMKPTTVSFINPVLVPLSNVMFTSGRIDSFNLRAIANDVHAIGEMQMYYRDLRIKLVKGGDASRSGFKGRVATFLVNTFIIKKNNKGRTGYIYYERAKDRSFFNYLVKTIFSGMATSIGVKKNRKYIKQYKKALQKRDLPQEMF